MKANAPATGASQASREKPQKFVNTIPRAPKEYHQLAMILGATGVAAARRNAAMMTDELLAPRPAKKPTITQTSVHTTIAVATAGFWIPPSTSRNTVSLIAKRPNGSALTGANRTPKSIALGAPAKRLASGAAPSWAAREKPGYPVFWRPRDLCTRS